jgi:sugar lactone lactonase YvrE
LRTSAVRPHLGLTARLILAATVILGLGLTPAGAGVLTQDACGSAPVVTTWKSLGANQLENLLFDAAGTLWISDTTGGAIRRFNAAGIELTGLTGVPNPGGLAQASDGTIIAGWGNGIANAARRAGWSKVVRFSPADPAGTLADVRTGFNMVNGLTIGPNGDVYFSDDVDY